MKTGLAQIDKKYDCTFGKSYSLDLAPEDHDDFCKDIPGRCPGEADELITTNRTFEDEDGKKKITIEIGAETDLEEFRYWEELPKCITEGFITFFENPETYQGEHTFEIVDSQIQGVTDGQVIFNVNIGGTQVELIIENTEPLMVWHFSGTNLVNEKISYILDTLQEEITSDCLRELKGVVTNVDTPLFDDDDNDGIDNGDDLCDGGLWCKSNDPCDANNPCDTSTWNLICDASGHCSFCGNGIIEGAEVCDGIDVSDASCSDFGLSGTLHCLTDCTSLDVLGSCS